MGNNPSAGVYKVTLSLLVPATDALAANIEVSRLLRGRSFKVLGAEFNDGAPSEKSDPLFFADVAAYLEFLSKSAYAAIVQSQPNIKAPAIVVLEYSPKSTVTVKQVIEATTAEARPGRVATYILGHTFEPNSAIVLAVLGNSAVITKDDAHFSQRILQACNLVDIPVVAVVKVGRNSNEVIGALETFAASAYKAFQKHDSEQLAAKAEMLKNGK